MAARAKKQATADGRSCLRPAADRGGRVRRLARADQLREQGSEQLRRAAIALVVTWAEGRVEAEEVWLDGFIQEHYRLLGELGYQPSEVETGELAKAQAVGSPGDPRQDGR